MNEQTEKEPIEIKIEFQPKLSPLETINKIKTALEGLLKEGDISAFAILVPAAEEVILTNWQVLHAAEAEGDAK